MDAVQKRDRKSGDRLVTFKVAAFRQQGPADVCPAWGCGGCPPSRCQIIEDGGDSDNDGIQDALEAQLADSFTPSYHVSAGEHFQTGFAIMNDNPPESVKMTYGSTPPISYYAVSSAPTVMQGADGNYYRYIRVDYLTLWNEDDGLAGSYTCPAILGSDLGLAFDFTSGIVGADVATLTAGLGGILLTTNILQHYLQFR